MINSALLVKITDTTQVAALEAAVGIAPLEDEEAEGCVGLCVFMRAVDLGCMWREVVFVRAVNLGCMWREV